MADATTSDPNPLIADLLGCIAQYDREYDNWKKRAKKIVKRYRDDERSAGNGGSSCQFNILWSNVQTLVPATFARLPQPDVSRRFRDNDPVGRVAALILERALEYEVGQYSDYGASMRQCVHDRFLGGRGTAWVRYEPHFRAMAEQVPTDGVEVSEDVDSPQEELDYECSPVDYVHWEDFGHSVARTWEEVSRVWRIVYMNEPAVKERFGEDMAKKVPYDSSPEKKNRAIAGDQTPKQAKIYELWDKTKKKAYWFSKSLNEVIDERDDPLQLSDFWPCPKPLYATITNETLVPVPDFTLYQDQANELNVLADRIDGLIKALQVKGVYDSAVPELARLFTEAGNTDLIPVKNFAAFAEKNGLTGALDLVDLTPFAAALKEAYLAMSQVKEYIYEITGISDIVRGETNANETLGAQQIKQNFVGLRLKDMQGGVAKFAAEALCIKGQIICAKYAPATIAKIAAVEQLSEADKQYIQPALALLVGPERMADPEAKQGPNPTRQFRIDVEADSLIRMDEQQDKTDRLEFLKATGSFIKEAFPIIQASPESAPLLVAMLKFGVTAFKVGRTIEGDFDQALDQLKQAAMTPKPPPPNPELIAAENDKARIALDAKIHDDEMMMKSRELDIKAREVDKPEAQPAPEVVDPELREVEIADKMAHVDLQVAQAEAARKQASIAETTAAVGADKTKAETQAIKAPVEEHAQGLDSIQKSLQAVSEAMQKTFSEQAGKEVKGIERVMGSNGRLAAVRRKHADGSMSEIPVQ